MLQALASRAPRTLLPSLLALAPAANAQDAILGPSVNSFLAGGKPTLVVGTLGDERCDRAIRAQARMIRGMLFSESEIVDDVSIDVERGPEAWPERAVLYGGAHMNEVVRALAPVLPLQVDDGIIQIGTQHFDGPDYRLIAVFPARTEGEGLHHPEFVLYAGAATPGVEEINAVEHGFEGFLVVDRWGVCLRGRWQRNRAGEWEAASGPMVPRIPWQSYESPGVREGGLRIWRVQALSLPQNAFLEEAAFERAFDKARTALGVEKSGPFAIYVYPDAKSKLALTRKSGDGHSDILSGTVHLLTFDPSPAGPLERLATHELTHLIAARHWGAPGSALLGEGLAVWAGGSYGGLSLEHWIEDLPTPRPTFEELSTTAFSKLPERYGYPIAGLWVGRLIEKVGLEAFRDHLYGATLEEWPEACKRAGTDAESLAPLWP